MSLSKYIHVMNTEYFTNILHSGDKIYLTCLNLSQGSNIIDVFGSNSKNFTMFISLRYLCP